MKFILKNDYIDVFGHSRESMPGGVGADTLSNKIAETATISDEWQGSIRIFSCYGGDENEYNVDMAKEFSQKRPGLKGVGGSTKMVNIGKSSGSVGDMGPIGVKKGGTGWNVALKDRRSGDWVRKKREFRGNGPGQVLG